MSIFYVYRWLNTLLFVSPEVHRWGLLYFSPCFWERLFTQTALAHAVVFSLFEHSAVLLPCFSRLLVLLFFTICALLREKCDSPAMLNTVLFVSLHAVVGDFCDSPSALFFEAPFPFFGGVRVHHSWLTPLRSAYLKTLLFVSPGSPPCIFSFGGTLWYCTPCILLFTGSS